jgi:ribonuclease BN (tRNA processing enzyme)
VRITVVGSGTVAPSLQRRQSCVVVRAGGETLVFDLGSGAVRGMLRAGLDPFSVDRVFFTHFHPDHSVDVVPLPFSINYGSQEQRTRALHVSGPRPPDAFGRGAHSKRGRREAGRTHPYLPRDRQPGSLAEEVGGGFDGEIIVAEDGLTLEV